MKGRVEGISGKKQVILVFFAHKYGCPVPDVGGASSSLATIKEPLAFKFWQEALIVQLRASSHYFGPYRLRSITSFTTSAGLLSMYGS